jgi:hypothetical protein
MDKPQIDFKSWTNLNLKFFGCSILLRHKCKECIRDGSQKLGESLNYKRIHIRLSSLNCGS